MSFFLFFFFPFFFFPLGCWTFCFFCIMIDGNDILDDVHLEAVGFLSGGFSFPFLRFQ